MKMKKTKPINKYYLLTKVIFANIKHWLEVEKDNDVIFPEIAIKLKGFATRYLIIHHGFDDDEAKFMKTLETEHFKKMMEPEISYLVFCLELARLWYKDVPKDKRPHTGISGKKLLLGSRLYVIDMLKLKKENNEKYRETKELINQTNIVARKFYEYMKTNCVDKYYGEEKCEKNTEN